MKWVVVVGLLGLGFGKFPPVLWGGWKEERREACGQAVETTQ